MAPSRWALLPGYAPDLNPVEYLWAWLKRHALAEGVWKLDFSAEGEVGGRVNEVTKPKQSIRTWVMPHSGLTDVETSIGPGLEFSATSAELR